MASANNLFWWLVLRYHVTKQRVDKSSCLTESLGYKTHGGSISNLTITGHKANTYKHEECTMLNEID